MTHDGIPKVNDLLALSWSRRNRSTGVEHIDPQTEWTHMKQHEGGGEIFKQMLQNGQIPAGVKNLGQMGSGQ